jgi:hypothetical protein
MKICDFVTLAIIYYQQGVQLNSYEINCYELRTINIPSTASE